MDNTDQQLGSTDQHMGSTYQHMGSTYQHMDSTYQHMNSTDRHMHSTDPEMDSTKGQGTCDERGDEVKTNIDTVVNIGDNSNPDILGGEAGGDVVTACQGDVMQENNEYSEHNREFEAHVIIDQKTLTHMISEDSDLSPDSHTDASAQEDVPVELATDVSANSEQLVSVRPTERYPSSRKGAKKEKISPLKKKESMTKKTLHPNSPTPMSVETCDSSMSMTSVDMCRICQCDSCEILADSPLLTPCLCAGSLKYIHQACLQKWIKSSDKMSCELCQFEYQMTKKTKPFGEWEKLEMTSAERRKVVCSVTFHVIAITCVIWSLYVLIDRTTEEVEAGSLLWPFWTKLIVVAIGFTGGVVFMYVQCKMYLTLCKKWRMYNKVILIGSISEGEREKANHAGILRLCREKQMALEGVLVTNLDDVFNVVHETSERVSATDVV